MTMATVTRKRRRKRGPRPDTKDRPVQVLTGFQLSKEQLDRLDKCVRGKPAGTTRSHLFREALEEYLDRQGYGRK